MTRNLLWVDCTAGALAGAVVLALSGWLATLHGLPRGLLLFTGAVNLLYAGCSFSLARRPRRPRALVHLLVFANAGWAAVCLALAAAFAASATAFGMAHLVGEALFVGGLAAAEWRWREQLLVASRPAAG